MTQALVTLGLGPFGSVGQAVLVGLSPAPQLSDPIDWIEFTATGAVPRAAAIGAGPQCLASIAGPLSPCVASEAAASGSGAAPMAGATGRPLR